MTGRGEYRAISRLLVNSPEFQQLPERAKLAHLLLKVNCGPSGIEVAYPAETAARLSAQIGAPLRMVDAALASLEAAGWIRREGNLLWISGQLADDPHIKQTDSKHRTMIQRHIAGLGRLPIVVAFVHAHRGWFTVDGQDAGEPVQALRWAFEGPSMVHARAFEAPRSETEKESEQETETETDTSHCDTRSPSAARVRPDDPDFALFWSLLPKRAGTNSKEEARKSWNARRRQGVTAEAMQEGARRYKACVVASGSEGTPYVMQGKTFLGPAEQWTEPFALPVQQRTIKTLVVEKMALFDEWQLWHQEPKSEMLEKGARMVAAGHYASIEEFEREQSALRPDQLGVERKDRIPHILEERLTRFVNPQPARQPRAVEMILE
jgi:hypothetical protein